MVWHLTPVADIGESSNPPKEVNEEVIRHAHIGGRNRWHYGCTFGIESDTEPDRYCEDGVEVLLRVECDNWGWGFYGLVAVEQTTNGKRQVRRSDQTGWLFDEWGQRMSECEDRWHTDSEWWLAWTWPTENVDLRKKTTWLAHEVIRGFVEGEGVDPLVRNICKTMDRIEDPAPSTG